MTADRRRRRRIFVAAFLLFVLSLVAPPGRSQPQLPAARPPAAAAKTAEPKPGRVVEILLKKTAADMPAATPAERRAWAGMLAALGDLASARRLAGKPPDAAARGEFIAELIRRGHAEIALPLLDATRPPPPDAAWLRAAAHWQLGELALVPRDLADVPSYDRGSADFVGQLVAMAARGQPPGLRNNPWRIAFLDGSGRYVPRPGEPDVPAVAAIDLSTWLERQPNDGGAWALLAFAALRHGAADEALDCLLRAESRGQASPELSRLKADLQRQRADRNRSALAGADDPPAPSAAEPPAAFDPASVRALAAAGVGGVLLGLLIGLQLRSRRPRRQS